MNEAVFFALGQLVHEFGCRWAAMYQEENGERAEVACVGDPEPEAGETIAVSVGVATLSVAFAFTEHATERQKLDARALAGTLANGFASLRVVRSAESHETGCILIVDDDIGIRTLVRRVLEGDGFVVIEAPDGLSGQARALEFMPDLIISDMMMPRMDGIEASIRIKNDPVTASIPIVMLTSRSQPEDRIAALDAGIQDFLVKPFAPAELTRSVRQQLRWRRLLADPSAELIAVPPRPPGAAAASPALPDLAQFVALAESAEERADYALAANAYTDAADLAGTQANPDVANKFRRLAGKMYLLMAENGRDPATIQLGYTSAARTFLEAGNITLAQSVHGLAQEATGPGR